MAEDAGDKTEAPTPRRRAEAREEGQIARSADLTAAVALLAGIMLLKALGPRMLDAMFRLTRALGEAPDITVAGLPAWIKRVGLTAAELIAPFLGLLIVVTIAATLSQSGIVLAWKKLGVKPDRINPVSGFKRVFSTEALTRLAIGLFKMTLVGLVAWHCVKDRLGALLTTGVSQPGGVLTVSAALIFDLAVRLGVVLLILGIVDYLIQRWKLERQLRMTKQEVRDELKRMEGDPLVKHRRRQIQARLAMQRIHADVPKADVVVTNPTEYAIALKYDEATMPAPRVLAKGKDLLAARIRQVAQQNRIPIVERPPLARALYAAVDVGQEIPPAFYRAVAEVLAYVYQLSRKVAG